MNLVNMDQVLFPKAFHSYCLNGAFVLFEYESGDFYYLYCSTQRAVEILTKQFNLDIGVNIDIYG